MRLFKRKPVGQLWVHYGQVSGCWQWRVSTKNVIYYSTIDHPTEYEALDAAEEAFVQCFPGLPVPVPRIFRTGADYYAAVIENGRWRK